MTRDDKLTALLERESPPDAGTTQVDVEYEVDGTACRGYLARPAVGGPRPGVLVLHDWLGVGEHVRVRTEMLARLGYVAFAVDIYGADTRPTAAEARSVIGRFFADPELWHARLRGGWERMTAEPGVDRERTAAIGFCFGGASALELALLGVPLRTAISFHGSLPTQLTPEKVTASLLILHGDRDPLVDDAAVDAFVSALREVDSLDWQLVRYAEAVHAFAVPGVDDPEHGARFDPRAERRAWRAMADQLADALC